MAVIYQSRNLISTTATKYLIVPILITLLHAP
jgi:hypothetical protein